MTKPTNQPIGANMNEIISRCGYCGDVIDFCQGHGEDERKAFGFEPDSDKYEKRREEFEADGLQADLNRAALVIGPMLAEELRKIG